LFDVDRECHGLEIDDSGLENGVDKILLGQPLADRQAGHQRRDSIDVRQLGK